MKMQCKFVKHELFLKVFRVLVLNIKPAISMTQRPNLRLFYGWKTAFLCLDLSSGKATYLTMNQYFEDKSWQNGGFWWRQQLCPVHSSFFSFFHGAWNWPKVFFFCFVLFWQLRLHFSTSLLLRSGHELIEILSLFS